MTVRIARAIDRARREERALPLIHSEALVRVRYEETDQTGVVYHGHYLRYFEVGRVELLRDRGISYRQLETQGFRLPVVEARIQYRAPARFDDVLRVRCELVRLRAARIDLSYAITESASGRLLATGEVVLACLGPEGRPARVPENVRCALVVDGEEARS